MWNLSVPPPKNNAKATLNPKRLKSVIVLILSTLLKMRPVPERGPLTFLRLWASTGRIGYNAKS